MVILIPLEHSLFFYRLHNSPHICVVRKLADVAADSAAPQKAVSFATASPDHRITDVSQTLFRSKLIRSLIHPTSPLPATSFSLLIYSANFHPKGLHHANPSPFTSDIEDSFGGPSACACHIPLRGDSSKVASNLSVRLASRAFRLAGLAVGLGLSAFTAYQRSQNQHNQPPNRAQMSSTSSGNGPFHLDATTGREVVYCHACANEWYRDEEGLTCPMCHGDVTEIVRYPSSLFLIYASQTNMTLD